jgi:hypothetical protein
VWCRVQDKLRIRKLVLALLKDSLRVLQQYRNEEDRCAALLSELRLSDVKPRKVSGGSGPDKHLAPQEVDMEMTDVAEAIASIRRAKLWGPVNDVFPGFGLVDPKEKGGLFDKNKKKAQAQGQAQGEGALALVPLTGVEIGVRVKGFACEVEVAQSYVNNSTDLIDAVYKFPLDEIAAITGFIGNYKPYTQICTEAPHPLS